MIKSKNILFVLLVTGFYLLSEKSLSKEKETPFTSKTKFVLTPVSTLELNPSDVNDSISYFVDMPGYGNCNISAYQKNKKNFRSSLILSSAQQIIQMIITVKIISILV